MKLNQSGLTIVELMISIGIAGVLATVLLTVSLTFFGSTIRSQVTSEMIVESHFALRTLTEDLRLGESILAAPTLTDANEPAGGWATSDSGNVLIISAPAVDSNNQVIYDESTGNPYTNELIYFVDDGVLHKRFLKNTLAAGNSVTTSCPEAAASSSCPADREYTTHADDIGLTFYDLNNVETADPTQARSVRFNLSMSRRVFGSTVNFDNSILVKLRN